MNQSETRCRRLPEKIGLIAILMGTVIGCGTSQTANPPTKPTMTATDVASSNPTASPQTSPNQSEKSFSASTAPTSTSTKDGSDIGAAITRAQMKEFLARGPQDFIQQVQVKPAFRQGKFFGWRIIDYVGPGPITRGDIVCRVNGRSIERPDEFMAVWQALSRQNYLEIELQRKAKPIKLFYAIVD